MLAKKTPQKMKLALFPHIPPSLPSTLKVKNWYYQYLFQNIGIILRHTYFLPIFGVASHRVKRFLLFLDLPLFTISNKNFFIMSCWNFIFKDSFEICWSSASQWTLLALNLTKNELSNWGLRTLFLLWRSWHMMT